MPQKQGVPQLTPTDLAAVNFLIVYLEGINRARMAEDGFIDSIVSVVETAAAVVASAASVIAARAATAANAAVNAVAEAAPVVAEDAVPVVEAVAAAGAVVTPRNAAAMAALIARISNTELQSQLDLQSLIDLRNQYS